MGYLSDHFNAWLLALGSLASTALATFILWGVVGNTFAGLIAFGIVYGVVAGGFSTLWTTFARTYASKCSFAFLLPHRRTHLPSQKKSQAYPPPSSATSPCAEGSATSSQPLLPPPSSGRARTRWRAPRLASRSVVGDLGA